MQFFGLELLTVYTQGFQHISSKAQTLCSFAISAGAAALYSAADHFRYKGAAAVTNTTHKAHIPFPDVTGKTLQSV